MIKIECENIQAEDKIDRLKVDYSANHLLNLFFSKVPVTNVQRLLHGMYFLEYTRPKFVLQISEEILK